MRCQTVARGGGCLSLTEKKSLKLFPAWRFFFSIIEDKIDKRLFILLFVSFCVFGGGIEERANYFGNK